MTADVLKEKEETENFTIAFVHEMQVDNDVISTNMSIALKEDIIIKSISLENKVNKGIDFEKAQTLTSENRRSLSRVKDDEKRTIIVKAIKDLILKDVKDNYGRLVGEVTGEGIVETN